MPQVKTLEISALGHRGEGVALIDTNRVFIPFTLPGETVRAEIDGNRGRLVELLAASPDRIAASCPHFGACGGCQVQHLTDVEYRTWKRGLVTSQLERAGIVAEVADVVPAHGAGRRRATLHATKTGAGFMSLRSHDIRLLDACPILVPALAAAPQIATAIAAAIGPCDVSFTATDLGLDAAISGKGIKPNAELTRTAARYDLARVAINGEVVLNYRVPTIRMGEADVPIPPGSFLQATSLAEETLAGLVIEAAKGAKSIADLFCGVGPFALRLAGRSAVYAADSDAPAIAALDAAHRKTKGLKAVTAEKRDLFRDPMSPFELNRFDTVIIDPPRAGARAQARELAGTKVARVVYVSCDPQSFARDAAILVAGGYRMGRVTPVDQFLHSAHVELLAVFSR
ncbi:class I SAM-dependent RNA methyltransferase [Pelagibacterium xiamenense]|uniref:class I SAM-dependent RNA methyltransferase n=1 Tax=Pelagibacterium xiamenense TaxID=2901140 RepID=UPI001E493DEB|nr:TRAM domain-containing protein [Pelagibacterium xiamenense]MCD7058721.1 RNA methyltransferase [Pelagibacterium xiamenense]